MKEYRIPSLAAGIAINDSLGVILLYNRGSALLYDEALINGFIPSLNQLFLEQAELLFQ